MRRSMWWAWLVAAAWLAGCGGGISPTAANLRFVNASSGYSALDLRVDGARQFGAVGFGDSASYAEVEPDKTDSVVTLPGSATALVSLTPALKKKKHYTLLAWGTEGALKTELLDDNQAAESGKTRLRVLNAAPDAGAVDIYLTGASDPLASAVALHAGATVGSVSGLASVAAASWRLRVTRAGDRSELLLDVNGIALAGGQVATLVLTPTTGGVLVNALLLTQQGRIERLAGTLARVRVAAPNTGTVSASIGGTVLMNAVGTPAIGPYALVASGRQAVSVSVDGAPLAIADVTLAPGTDQTLLVWRQLGAAAATWIVDDNRLPAAAGTARLRLVHGLDGLAGALSMKANFLPVANDVAAGSASAYGSVAASLNVRLTVSATGDPAPVFDATDQALLAGGVYSVFTVEGVAPDRGVLRRDR